MRGDNDYPVTIASTFLNPDQFAPYGTLQQGIPKMAGPDLSSDRVPLDRAAAVYTPEIDNIDRGVHPHVERRDGADAAVRCLD
jgi:hypothetical protein